MATIWLIKDAEPLPLDPAQRPLRTGLVAKKLIEAGHTVHWFASRFEHARKKFVKGPATQLVSPGLTIHLLDGPGYSSNISIARIRHQRALAKDFDRLSQYLLTANPELSTPDLVVASYPAPELCLAACNLAVKTKSLLYVDVRDPWPDSFTEYFSPLKKLLIYPLLYHYRSILKKCITKADGILTISTYMMSWVLSYADRQRSTEDKVFYLGHKPTNDTPLISDTTDKLKLIFVGTFGKSYNCGAVIKAVKILNKKGYKDKLHLTLVGEGENITDWKKLAAECDNIIFSGWLSGIELESALAHSDVGLIPIQGGVSKFWIGNKLFEYSAHGLAIISTVPNETKEILHKANAGQNIFVDNGDSLPDAIANSIELYLNNPDLLRQHRLNSYNLFQHNFNSDIIYSQYIEHITKNLSKNNRSAMVDSEENKTMGEGVC